MKKGFSLIHFLTCFFAYASVLILVLWLTDSSEEGKPALRQTASIEIMDKVLELSARKEKERKLEAVETNISYGGLYIVP